MNIREYTEKLLAKINELNDKKGKTTFFCEIHSNYAKIFLHSRDHLQAIVSINGGKVLISSNLIDMKQLSHRLDWGVGFVARAFLLWWPLYTHIYTVRMTEKIEDKNIIAEQAGPMRKYIQFHFREKYGETMPVYVLNDFAWHVKSRETDLDLVIRAEANGVHWESVDTNNEVSPFQLHPSVLV